MTVFDRNNLLPTEEFLIQDCIVWPIKISSSFLCQILPYVSLNGRWWHSLRDGTILRINLQLNCKVIFVEYNNYCWHGWCWSSKANELKGRFATCCNLNSLWARRHKLTKVAQMIKHWLWIEESPEIIASVTGTENLGRKDIYVYMYLYVREMQIIVVVFFFFLAKIAAVCFIFIALIFIIVIITICWLLCNWWKAHFCIVSFWLYGEVYFRILLFLTVSQLGMRENFLFSSLATTLPQKPIFLADDHNFVQNWFLLEWKWKIATKFIPVYRKVLSLHLQ